MKKQFDLLKTTRNNVIDFASKFSIEELNIVPANFNNNILWNAAHLIATQQVLFYNLSNLEYTVYLDFIERYRKGTKPEKFIGEEEWKFIKDTLIQTLAPTYDDYLQKRFQSFRSYETSYGFVLDNIDDVIVFNNAHEAMHFGFMKAIGKAIRK